MSVISFAVVTTIGRAKFNHFIPSIVVLRHPRGANERRNHQKMAEMVKLISERGPEIDEISRAIGVYNETARYWFRQLLRKGCAIQGSCNYERLGIKRVIAVVELGALFEGCADTVFSSMGDLCYVTGYAGEKSGRFQVLNASVPEECLSSWMDFMTGLRRIGVFKSVENILLDWVRNVPMRAEYFDFETGRWTFDWGMRTMTEPPEETRGDDLRVDYDVTDLRIIEQLQINANSSLRQMCRKLGINKYNAFTWHYREHVLGRGLVRGFRVNWTGMRFGSGSEALAETKHRYSWVDVFSKDISQEESHDLRRVLHQTPFLWIEGLGTRAFYARLALPSDRSADLLRLLKSVITGKPDGIKWIELDHGRALSFSLPSQFYDDQEQKWTFRKEEVLQRFEILSKVRHEVVYGHQPPDSKDAQ